MEMSQEVIKNIKHQFMAFRNGIVADTLRNAGMPYKIIFGLQLPQLKEIADTLPKDMELAKNIWDDKNVRESRLLACYLFPKDMINEKIAMELAESVQTTEEADILCFRLLRYLPFAKKLVDQLIDSQENNVAYCGKALLRNLDAIS